MGHGVASSLVSMSVRSLLRGLINNITKPKSVMKELNHHLITLFSNDSVSMKRYFVTGVYVLIGTNEKRIHYSSTGHPPGFLIDENGEVSSLDIGCIPLGMLPDIEVQEGSLEN